MEVLKTIQTIRKTLHIKRMEGKTIGLVPTMGGLHGGHLALVNKCRSQNDITVSSIYVNPIQFNNPVDLKNYPRSLEKDLELLRSSGCDLVFVPGDKEMYSGPNSMSIEFGESGNVMEGKFRPGHFSGVGIVVTKLFNIIQPDRAYFGEKDFQQLMIIRQLVRTFNFGIEIVGIPTVREKSGLAMSSRNARLNKEQLRKAAVIYSALKAGRDVILSGHGIKDARGIIYHTFSREPEVEPEYVEFVDVKNMRLLKDLNRVGKLAICAAASIGQVRLIDNIIFDIEEQEDK